MDILQLIGKEAETTSELNIQEEICIERFTRKNENGYHYKISKRR